MGKTLIRYKGVEICQKEQVVLKDVNLEIGEGEFYYLIGKVGTGKSSLMKTMYAELPIETGEATLLDYDLLTITPSDVPFLRRQLGIIFQDFQLLIDRTVNENLLFVLKATGWKDKEEMQARIDAVLKEVGMSNKGYKMPHELSGGEQQRIVIARALLNKPKLILADEPTGNLDPLTGAELVELLYTICKEENTTIIMATHNLGWIDAFPGKVLAISQNKLCSGTKDECIFDY
jgi:cell division transport system ATP-binding protein